MRIGIDASRAFDREPTGTERYSLEIISRLVKLPEARDHEWVLYTRREVKEEGFPENVKVVFIPLKRLWTQKGLALKTWEDKLDLLWVPAHTLPVLRRPGLKTVVTVHGIEYEWLPAYENWLQKWYLPLSTKYAVARADRIIAVSRFTAEQLVSRLGADSKKIEVVHEGATVPKKVKNGVRCLERLGLRKRKYLLFVGTIQPRKNLIRLIEAFSRLKNKELKLVICGKPGWAFEEVYAAPKKCGVQDRVVFTGYVDDAQRCTLLAFALFYVQPSVTEGFGLPVLEAWSAGLAVASSRGGALEEVVGDAGIMFDAKSVEDMTDKMRMLIEDRDWREKLAAAGRKRLGEFSWAEAAKRTCRILLETAKLNL